MQLYYQIALTGQQDLPLAPDPRVGFEMVLLRALAFRPAGSDSQAMPLAAPAAETPSRRQPAPAGRPGMTSGAPQDATPPTRPYPDPPADLTSTARPTVSKASTPGVREDATPALASTTDWHRLVDGLRVGGVASQLAHNCTLLDWTAGRLTLALDPAAEQLRSRGTEQRLREALEGALGVPVQLDIQIARPEQETPAQRRVREGEERQLRAQEAMDNDPVVLGLREQLDAQWVPGSLQATD